MESIKTVNIGGMRFLLGDYAVDPSIGAYTRMLSAFARMVEDGTYALQMVDGSQYSIVGRQRYAYNLRQRVANRIHEKLATIASEQNKKCGRRYVHWSNSDGRFFDEGE